LILMTAYGNRKVQDMVRQLQVYRYITKPFQTEELLDAIRTLTEVSQEPHTIGQGEGR
jgi:DNA-binding response OmpR family regulator